LVATWVVVDGGMVEGGVEAAMEERKELT